MGRFPFTTATIAGVMIAAMPAVVASGLTGAAGADRSASTQPMVELSGGEALWSVAAPRRAGPAWLSRARPCLEVATGTAGATRVCLVSRHEVKVTRPDATTYRAPADVATTSRGWSVRMRQADLSLRPGRGQVSSSCRAARCPSVTKTVTVPRLRVASCQARGPWLVHEGDPEVGKAVALTFDDGPGALTAPVLRILRREQAPATFFALGTMVRRDPTSIERIVRAGHAVGNHSDTHPVLSGDDARQLTRTNHALTRAGAPQPCLFRAPYGENPPAVVDMARALGMVTVHWNTDPGDWRHASSDQMVATTLAQVRPGSIIVLHDGASGTSMPRALPRIIDSLAERGYRFLTVPELLRLPVTYR